MIETDSTELFECIQKHIFSAHLYMYSYLLPILEANIYRKENIFQDNNYIISVRVNVSNYILSFIILFIVLYSVISIYIYIYYY